MEGRGADFSTLHVRRQTRPAQATRPEARHRRVRRGRAVPQAEVLTEESETSASTAHRCESCPNRQAWASCEGGRADRRDPGGETRRPRSREYGRRGDGNKRRDRHRTAIKGELIMREMNSIGLVE